MIQLSYCINHDYLFKDSTIPTDQLKIVMDPSAAKEAMHIDVIQLLNQRYKGGKINKKVILFSLMANTKIPATH